MLTPHHRQEFVESAIAPALIDLNFESIEGDQVYELLCQELDFRHRINTGRLRFSWLRKYENPAKGGWYFSGNYQTDWSCFKADTPRQDKDGKKIKYEHPAKMLTGVYRPTLDQETVDKILRRYGVEEKVSSLDFWEKIKDYPEINIIITEGVKKTLSLLSQGYCSIGVSGVWNTRDKNKKLKQELKDYCQKDREFILVFDNDEKPKTVKNVNKAIFSLGVLLKKEKGKVSIRKPLEYKGIDDFIYNLGYPALEKLIELRKDFDQWVLEGKQKLTPDKTVSQRFLDLSEFLSELTSHKLIGLKSPKGTGKTEQLTKIVETLIRKGERVLLITHRIQLGRQLSSRFGLDWIDDLKDSESVGGLFGFGVCIDSLHQKGKGKISLDEWEGCTVIIDESEQVVSHLLTANTEVSKHRMNVIETLQGLLSVADNVYLSDADLSRFSVGFIQQLGGYGKKETLLIENSFTQRLKRELISYKNPCDPSELLSDVEDKLTEGQKILLLTTGQKVKSKWGSISLEKYISKRYPEKTILRIDSESVADPDHPSYGIMGRLNETIKPYDIVIATPTIETGVSIEKEIGFNAVFGIFWGSTLSVNSVCQMLERYRGDCPRYVWIETKGRNKWGGHSSVNGVKSNLFQNGKFLRDFFKESDTFYNLLIDPFEVALNSYCSIIALNNGLSYQYRENIKQKLLKEGYSLFEKDSLDPESLKEIREAVEENRQETYSEHCKDVSKAQAFTYSHYQAIKNKKEKNETERIRVKKSQVVYSYFLPETPKDLIEKHDENLYSKLQLFFLLQKSEENLREYDQERIERIKENNDGKIFTPDLLQKTKSNKVRILGWLNPLQFLGREDICHKSLEEWHKTIYPFKAEIKLILGVTLDRYPVKALKQLSEMIGLTLKRVKQSKEGVRFYSLTLGDTESKILENWTESDRLKKKFSLTQNDLLKLWEENDYSFENIEELIRMGHTEADQVKNEGFKARKQGQTLTEKGFEVGHTGSQYIYSRVCVTPPVLPPQNETTKEADPPGGIFEKWKEELSTALLIGGNSIKTTLYHSKNALKGSWDKFMMDLPIEMRRSLNSAL